MERSENIGDLIAALAKAQAEFTAIIKDTKNEYYGSKYAQLEAVVAAVRPALSKHGIAFFHIVGSDLERQTASVNTYLCLGEQFIGVSAEVPAVSYTKDGKQRFDAQTISIGWTYLKRTQLTAITGVAPEDDDDANALVGSNAPIRAARSSSSTASQIDQWNDAFEEAATIDEFNKHIVPLMKERGREFAILAAGVAKKRGWRPNRETGVYEVGKAQ